MKQRAQDSSLPAVRTAAVLLAVLVWAALGSSAAVYYPPSGGEWGRRAPAEAGFDPALLDAALEYARGQAETKTVEEIIQARMRHEVGSEREVIGPTRTHGPSNGLVLRGGYIVAEFGDTGRVDMTFSVTKSFLSALAGLALERKLIRSLEDPIRLSVRDGGFESPHNARIKWRHMLTQTSEWEGSLWDKSHKLDEDADHQLGDPGTVWNYNDTRVNRLSLALLRIWRRPLPEILKREIMDPIGATDTWEWHGYRNSDVTISGATMKSVSGGGHWGGGLFISTRDQARFGYLFLRRGRWRDRQLVPESWVDRMTTPVPQRPEYGYLWWLSKLPGAVRPCFAAQGAGGNTIWVDPEHDLVVVLRWTRNGSEVVQRIAAAVRSGS